MKNFSIAFITIIGLGLVTVGVKSASADGPVTEGSCPDGMKRAVVKITWDTDDDKPVQVTPPDDTCIDVDPVLLVHPSSPPPPTGDDEIEMEGDDAPTTSDGQRFNDLSTGVSALWDEVRQLRAAHSSAQAQKPGRWNAGVLLGYPSAEVGAVVLGTLSGTFRRGELAELRLEGSAGMTDNKVGIFGGSALVYGHLSQHLLVGVGPTLTYETRFSKMLEEPDVRQLGAAIELVYQVKVSSPSNLDLEMFGRVGAVWQRVDGPEMGPLKDSGQVPAYIGWRALF